MCYPNYSSIVTKLIVGSFCLLIIGCGYTEEEYLAVANDANKYQNLAEDRQATVVEQNKRLEEIQSSTGRLSQDLKKVNTQKSEFEAQNARYAKDLLKTRNQLRIVEAELVESNALNQKLEERIGNYEMTVTNLEFSEQEIRDKYVKLQGEEERLQQRITDYQNQLKQRDERQKDDQISQQNLVRSLRKQLESGQAKLETDQVKITELANRVAVRLDERLLFDSGKAFIKASGFEVLKKIGAVLKKIEDKHIQVEGHTDNIPIKGSLRRKYPTNWELSMARAAQVARYLVDEVKIDPKLISAAGFGEFQPIADNKTAEGRRANRRVEFALLPLRRNIGN